MSDNYPSKNTLINCAFRGALMALFIWWLLSLLVSFVVGTLAGPRVTP